MSSADRQFTKHWLKLPKVIDDISRGRPARAARRLRASRTRDATKHVKKSNHLIVAHYGYELPTLPVMMYGRALRRCWAITSNPLGIESNASWIEHDQSDRSTAGSPASSG